MSAENPQNRRRQRRRTVTAPVNIYNKDTGEMLGRLVNITTEGLMLVNTRPLAADRLYQAVIELPEPVNEVTRLELGIDSLWTSPANPDADMFWSGCQIIDISDEMLGTLKVVIEQLGD